MKKRSNYVNNTELDVEDLYNPEHQLSKCFDGIKVEKHPTQDFYLIHFNWKSPRYSVSLDKNKLEKNGKEWWLSFHTDSSDSWLLDYEEKEKKREVIYSPVGIEKVIVDEIIWTAEYLLNGFEASAGVPDSGGGVSYKRGLIKSS